MSSLVRSLDASEIVAAAEIDPSGWPQDERATIEEGLEAFCSAFESANGRARFARFFAWSECIRSLRGYEAVLPLRQGSGKEPQHPKPTVVIAGAPRTGTTFLHQLIARDPRSEWLSFEKAHYPALAGEERLRLATERLVTLDRMGPKLRAIHPLAPGEPDECTPLMQLSLASCQFSILFNAPGYLDWLLNEADMKLHYRITWEHLNVAVSRASSDFRLLKNPFHSLWLDEVIDTFDDVLIVVIKRDEREVDASWTKLLTALRGFDRGSLTREDEERWAEVMEQIKEASRPESLRGSPFVELAYENVLDDPLDAIGSIYDRIGLSRPAGDIRDAMEMWVEESRRAHAARKSQPGV